MYGCIGYGLPTFFILVKKVLYVNNIDVTAKIKLMIVYVLSGENNLLQNLKYWIPPNFKKVSKTSLPRSRRNFKLCKAQLPDHKRYYLSGLCVCLSFRKAKLWNGWAFKASYVWQLFFSLSPFVRLIFILHSNLCCGIFLSPCKLDVLFLEYICFCPAMLFAYSSSDIEGLFSSYYF